MLQELDEAIKPMGPRAKALFCDAIWLTQVLRKFHAFVLKHAEAYKQRRGPVGPSPGAKNRGWQLLRSWSRLLRGSQLSDLSSRGGFLPLSFLLLPAPVVEFAPGCQARSAIFLSQNALTSSTCVQPTLCQRPLHSLGPCQTLPGTRRTKHGKRSRPSHTRPDTVDTQEQTKPKPRGRRKEQTRRYWHWPLRCSVRPGAGD